MNAPEHLESIAAGSLQNRQNEPTMRRNSGERGSKGELFAGLLIPRSQVRDLPGPLVDEVRIDKWLWAARFYKTRGLASTAVLGGRVHVNGERVKASKPVRAGDAVDLTKGNERYTVTVTGLADKRGSAAVAQALYSESADLREQREQLALQRRVARVPGEDLGARPTKQARRRLDALRRGQRRSG